MRKEIELVPPPDAFSANAVIICIACLSVNPDSVSPVKMSATDMSFNDVMSVVFASPVCI